MNLISRKFQVIAWIILSKIWLLAKLKYANEGVLVIQYALIHLAKNNTTRQVETIGLCRCAYKIDNTTGVSLLQPFCFHNRQQLPFLVWLLSLTSE